MSNVPAVSAQDSAQDFVRVLKKLGFELHRQKGSHAVYKDTHKRRVILPIHSGTTLKPGTFAGMLKDAGLSREEFFRLL